MKKLQAKSIRNSNITIKAVSCNLLKKRTTSTAIMTTKKIKIAEHSDISVCEQQAVTSTDNTAELNMEPASAENEQVFKNAEASEQVKCQICEKTFLTTREVCKHMFNYHEISLFCETCPLYFTTELEKSEHAKSCKKIFQSVIFDGVCKICQEEFQDESSLQNHMVQIHKNIEESNITDSKLYICPYCGPEKSFPTEKLATKHIFWHHNKIKNLAQDEQKEIITSTPNAETSNTVTDPDQVFYVGKLVRSEFGDGFIFVPTLASEFKKGAEIELIEDNLTQISIVHPVKPLPELTPFVKKSSKPTLQNAAVNQVTPEDSTLQNIEAVMSGMHGMHGDEIITYNACDITYVDMTIDNDATIISNDIFSGLSPQCVQKVNNHLNFLKQAYITKLLKNDTLVTPTSKYYIYCFSCNDNIEIVKYVSEHIKTCLPTSCYICGKTYKVVTSRTNMIIDYIQHLQDHTRFHSSRVILCKQCDRMFINTHNYTGHFAKFHAQKNSTIAPYKPTEILFTKNIQTPPQNNILVLKNAYDSLHEIYEKVKKRFTSCVQMQCVTCNIEFQLGVYILRHLEICLNKSTTMKCNFCPLFNDTNVSVVETEEKVKFIDHMKCHLNATENIPIKQCEFCQKYYLNSTNLAHHMEAVHSSSMKTLPTKSRKKPNRVAISLSEKPEEMSDISVVSDQTLSQFVILEQTLPITPPKKASPKLKKTALKVEQEQAKETDLANMKKSPKILTRPVGNFKCYLCEGLKFISEDSLLMHIVNTHSADKLINGHNCVACKFIAVTKWELQSHVLETHAKFLPKNFKFSSV